MKNVNVKNGSSNVTSYKPCHESHKELPLSGFFGGRIIGANCSNVRPGYDIYIALDIGPSKIPVWVDAKYIDYPITNMSVPSSKEDFRQFIKWLVKKFKQGAAIHVGCIGGHGRTGLVLAAFVAELTGRKDAAKFIREHHCKSGIESKSQMNFLVDLYGMDMVPIEDKNYGNSNTGGKQTNLSDSWNGWADSWDNSGSSRKSFAEKQARAGGWENEGFSRDNRSKYPKKTTYKAKKTKHKPKQNETIRVFTPTKTDMSLWY